jgi:predicted GNAT family acetyltransferase
MNVVNETDAERYTVWDGDDLQGFAVYDFLGNTIRILHVEVPETKRGQGLGGLVTRSVLDTIREDTAFRVQPVCSFAVRWMREHPEYADLAQR